MKSFQNTSLNLFSDEVAINFDVFRTLVVDGVGGNMEGSLIVAVEHSWVGVRKVKLSKKGEKPREFTASVGHTTVLGLGGGSRHGGLLLRLPREERRAEENAEAGDRSARVGALSPIRICESSQVKISLRGKK